MLAGKRFKAVGFDMDGTFMSTRVDYEKLNSTDLRVLDARGIPASEIDFGDSPKRLRAPIMEWLVAHGREGEFDSLNKEIDARLTECECEFVDEAAPHPGSEECIDLIKSMGLKVGILTRGSLMYAQRALGDMYPRFDAVMGRDHSFYDNCKPSPVAMTEFAELLGVEPEEILYVGDNTTDWMSARDAGASFVGVRTGSGSDELWNACDPDIPVIDYAGDVVDILRELI